MICSPFDTQARYNTKRQTNWVGYQVHLTEVCDPDSPHLITNVITTVATQHDTGVVSQLHQALADKDLWPSEHLLDQGYSASKTLLEAQEQYGVEMIMPMRSGHSWQQQSEKADSLDQFQIDGAREHVICPQGKESGSWGPGRDRQGDLRYEVMFKKADCGPCRARNLGTHSQRQRRKITLRPQN